MINNAKPRIIWSRKEHHAAVHQEASADAQMQPEHARAGEKGALSERQNQVVNDTEQMESASESEGPLLDQHLTMTASGDGIGSVEQTSGPVGSRQRSNGEPRTEIAVDWLNNLLFVLDKYRLLVVDYDGANELVLIDDFNDQPVNLKVDPINSFLFWLQVGKFHNTIYKLDLSVLDRRQNSSFHGASLVSRHYAHPIVTNLPIDARIFIIDHKHSRIYVPLSSQCENRHPDGNKIQRGEDAEVFSTPTDESNIITHMNSTSAWNNSESFIDVHGMNTNSSEPCNIDGQILAYNLDGTDVGPLRHSKKASHAYNFDDILDIALDNDKGLLYWLTNEGKDILEEYQGSIDTPYNQAQHNLEGKKYKKLIHYNHGNNQPLSKSRFNLRRLFWNLASTTATNRLTRSDSMEDQGLASSLNGLRNSEFESTGLTRYRGLLVAVCLCLVGLFIYLVYAHVSHPSLQHTDQIDSHSHNSSNGGLFMDRSRIGSAAHTSVSTEASTISRWIARPSTSSADASTFQRNMTKNEPLDSCEFESTTNYTQSNAVDEHYRESIYNQAIIQMEQNCLTNLSKWPSSLNGVSNRLYVPIELQEDETLSSIHRVSIDQLSIEKRVPLGEGHFGTVLQGTITCTVHERDIMLNKLSVRNTTANMYTYMQDNESREQAQNLPVPSSGSSGHGSSSVSSEFITANSVADAIHGDYLLPKSNANSASSDYSIENQRATILNSCASNSNYHNQDPMKETKFKVAIKMLKENASPKERSDFLQEAKHLAKFNHPNIVSLIGICLDKGATLIIMELMLGGDLIRYMQENKPAPSNQEKLIYDDLLSICLDIVNACCYLEEHEHIHRDLAARNCLVSSRKKEDRVVKLADFGLARDIYKDSYYKKLNDSAMPLKWMAPECFMEQKFTTKSDVWSFGVVMWEVMSYCQDKPYNNIEHFMMKDHLIEGLRLGRPEHCCEDVYRLMNDCWHLDPSKRPTFEECRATLIEIRSSYS